MRQASRRSGVALLLVLWVIGLLSLIVVSFAWDAKLEGNVASFARKQARAESLARSGVEIARMLLAKKSEITGNEEDEDRDKDRWYQVASDLHFGGSIHHVEKVGDDSITIRIEPVETQRNINKLKDEDWERTFEKILGLPDEYWPVLIDSFADWIDTDDNPRNDGAETDDYYSTLEKPYSAKNGPLDTIRELLLIRGFTEPILTGGILNPEDPKPSQITISNGVERLFSVFGDGTLNVNALSRNNILPLLTLPGIDAIAANAILEERDTPANGVENERDDTRFKDLADFRSRCSDFIDEEEAYGMVSFEPNYFKVESVGQVGLATRRIEAIACISDKDFTIVRWQEEP
jgi:general secretion pathway protein K